MYVNGSYEVANEQLCVNSFRRGRWIITRLCTEVMLFCSSNKARHEEGLVTFLNREKQEAWFPILEVLKLEPVQQKWKSPGEGGSCGSSSTRWQC